MLASLALDTNSHISRARFARAHFDNFPPVAPDKRRVRFPMYLWPKCVWHKNFLARGIFCSDIQLQVGLPTSLMRYAFEIEKESIGSLLLAFPLH